MSFVKYLGAAGLALALAACGGGGGDPGTPINSAPVTTTTTTTATATTTTTTATVTVTSTTTTTVTANSTVASIVLNSSANALNADGTSSLTLTVYALTSGNANVAGATIDLATVAGTDSSSMGGVILSVPSVVTTATGATFTVTAIASDQRNRVATVQASCTGCTASPVKSSITVNGAKLTLANSGTTSLTMGDASSSKLTATVKSFSGASISGVEVLFVAADPAVVNVREASAPASAAAAAASAATNALGVAEVAVSSIGKGSTRVMVSALGDAKSQAYTADTPLSVLTVNSPVNNALMVTNTPQTINVSAPLKATSVTFATTVGTFSNGSTSQNVPVSAGSASATLTATQAGIATVTMVDSLNNSANLSLAVSPPVSSANKVLLTASQTSLPLSLAGVSQNSLTLTARAMATDGVTDQAVANVPIQFSMTGGPNAGEFLTPALVNTNNYGVAVTTFTSGAVASISNGIKVIAAIQGTEIKTDILPSNNSALLTIGGQPMSVAFGPASVLTESADKTLYIHAYSVQVTDANNNPVAKQVVTLRMRPVAFSLGSPCTVKTSYCSEDSNSNGSLDTNEDGVRQKIANDLSDISACSSTATNTTVGTANTFLTPSNSDAGGVPSLLTTDTNGIASFNLTYLKGSALWVVNQLTATVSSNGTETSKSTIFRLSASVDDYDPPDTCNLPASPYVY